LQNPIKVGQSRLIPPNFGAGVESFTSSNPALVTVNSSTGMANCILDVSSITPVFIRCTDAFNTVIETYRLDVVPVALDLTAFNATFPSSPGVGAAILSALSIVSFATFAGQASANTLNGLGTAARFSNPQRMVYNAAHDVLLVTYLQGQALRKIDQAGNVTTLSTTNQFGPLATDGVDKVFYHSHPDFNHHIIYQYNLATNVETIVFEAFSGLSNNSGYGLACDNTGKLYLQLYTSSLIYAISSGSAAAISGLTLSAYDYMDSMVWNAGKLYYASDYNTITAYDIAARTTSTYATVTASAIHGIAFDPIDGSTMYVYGQRSSQMAIWSIASGGSPQTLLYNSAAMGAVGDIRSIAADKNRKMYSLIVNASFSGIKKST
jgi:hypothetical protein